jgi:hypothetical protein
MGIVAAYAVYYSRIYIEMSTGKRFFIKAMACPAYLMNGLYNQPLFGRKMRFVACQAIAFSRRMHFFSGYSFFQSAMACHTKFRAVRQQKSL